MKLTQLPVKDILKYKAIRNSYDEVFMAEMKLNELDKTEDFKQLVELEINRKHNYYLLLLLDERNYIIRAALSEKPVYYWYQTIKDLDAEGKLHALPKVIVLEQGGAEDAKVLRKKAKEINSNKRAYSRRYRIEALLQEL